MPSPNTINPTGFLASGQRKLPLRRWVRVAHLWAGVGLGLWLVTLGLTGSALVFQGELRQALEHGRKIKPGLPPLPMDELLSRVHQQRPDLVILEIDSLDQPETAWSFLVRPANSEAPERHSRFLLVDPGTGEIGAEQTSVSTVMGVIAQLHYNLLSGETGLMCNAFAGGLAIFFAVTGLTLWWRGRAKWKNGLKIKWKGATTRTRNYSIHSALGFYASLFLALTGLSGMYFAIPHTFLATAAHMQGSSLDVMRDFLSPPSSVSPAGPPDASATAVVELARRQFPQSRLSALELPQEPTNAWQFHFFPHGYFDWGDAQLVSIDRRSAKVLTAAQTRDLPFALRAVIALRPLHYGTFGGAITRVLWVFLGMTPAVLFFTGLVIWRKRVQAIPPQAR
ncbi:MAG TPA: PepSY-associated TM helix domain-containing protein [Acidobacteriaceae bacterium]